MKLLFKTTDPAELKADIFRLIEDKELKTWTIVEHKNVLYLRHTKQWGEKGVIKMEVDSKNSSLNVQVLKFTQITEEVKDFEGYYLGRFCEIIFVNLSEYFTSIEKQN